MLLYLLSALQCTLSSTLWHIFGCHSPCLYQRLLSLDFAGISALIFGSQVPIVFYLFLGHPWRLGFWMTGLIVVTVAASVVTRSEKCKSDEYAFLRVSCFALNALYGLLPFFAIVVTDGFSEDLVAAFSRVLVMYACYMAGVVVYLTRVPERWKPGAFDYFAHSHQVWHVLVVLAALAQFFAIVSVYEHHEQVCSIITARFLVRV
jgi:adiponectin receptor